MKDSHEKEEMSELKPAFLIDLHLDDQKSRTESHCFRQNSSFGSSEVANQVHVTVKKQNFQGHETIEGINLSARRRP